MFVACAIAGLGIARPNALSFGGANNAQFDPQNSGIIGWIRHPLLAVLLIWSCAHLVPNGDLAHVILFGVFAGFSFLGMKLIDQRKKRLLGFDVWQDLTHMKREVKITPNGGFRLFLAALIYCSLIALHSTIIGVSPLP